MQKFLLNVFLLFLFSLPLLVFAEWKARRMDDTPLRYRSEYLYSNADNLDGAAFGASLIARSINPDLIDLKLANVATAGSTMNVDYALFQEVNEQFTPQFVLFDISVHYLGRTNDKEFFDLKRLPYYYGVGTDEIGDFFLAHPPLRPFLEPGEPSGRFNEFGFELDGKKGGEVFAKIDYDEAIIVEKWAEFYPEKKMGKLRPALHKANEQLLKEIIATCRQQGSKVILFSPPKYYLFNEFIRERESMRLRDQFLEEVVDDENVFFLDFSTLGEEEPRNFSDFYHMSPVGARMASTALNHKINELMAK